MKVKSYKDNKMSLVVLVVVGVVVVAGVVVYKLWKSGKAVTGTAVVAGVEADLSTAEKAVANTVANTVVSKL